MFRRRVSLRAYPARGLRRLRVEPLEERRLLSLGVAWEEYEANSLSSAADELREYGPALPADYALPPEETSVAGEVANLPDNADAGQIKALDIAPLQITTSASLPSASLGNPYSTTFEAEGGVAPYTWSLIGGGSPVVITECNEGTPDYVEIQNVSGRPIDTSGWAVALNDAELSNINSVHGVVWELPASMPAGQALYRTDVTSDNYWGSNIWWGSATTKGWAMIVDDAGDVVDFTAWGYSQSQIAGMSVVVNGHTITIGSEWTGAGVVYGGTNSLSLQRRGSTDNNTGSDFAWTSRSKGIQNPSLNLPFLGTGAFRKGFRFDSLTGLISGTPTELGVFDFTVSVVDSQSPQQVATKQFSLDVVSQPPLTVDVPVEAGEGDGVLVDGGIVSIPLRSGRT